MASPLLKAVTLLSVILTLSDSLVKALLTFWLLYLTSKLYVSSTYIFTTELSLIEAPVSRHFTVKVLTGTSLALIFTLIVMVFNIFSVTSLMKSTLTSPVLSSVISLEVEIKPASLTVKYEPTVPTTL